MVGSVEDVFSLLCLMLEDTSFRIASSGSRIKDDKLFVEAHGTC